MIKTIGLMTRRDGMSQNEFTKHWVDVHARLVPGLPGLVRYAQSHIVEDLTGGRLSGNSRRIDGIAELWFSSYEAFKCAGETDHGKLLAIDDARFIGKLQRFVVEEKIIFG